MTPARPSSRTHAEPLLPRALSFLAPAALALPPLFILAAVTTEKNEAYEWLQHRLGAAGFATAFVTVLLGGCWRKGWLAFAAAALALGSLAIAARGGLPNLHALMILAGGLVAGGYHFASRREKPPWLETVAVGAGSILCFWAVSRLLGQPFDAVFAAWPNRILFIAATALPVALLCNLDGPAPVAGPGWRIRFIDALVLATLAAAVLRTNVLAGNPNFPHHWGVYIVPAELVRAGHAMLGDVPSQYGFLSTGLLAVIPTGDRFTALYWLHCSLVWGSGAVIYFTLRTWLARWWWQLAAGLVTISGVAFLCGDASTLTGCLLFPSVGALRFIWVHGLLGFLVWHHVAATKASPPRPTGRRMLWLGSGLWLLGVLWSVESAAYVTAVWLPAATLLAMPPVAAERGAWARMQAFLQGGARALVLTGIPLALAVAVIAGFYTFALGRSPQWSAYWEYAVAFSRGFGVLPIEPHGGVWVLVLLHTALLAALVSCDLARQRSAAALIWAAWGALWAVSTYFISRSHTNNITNLSPVLLLIIGVMVHALRDAGPPSLARPWLWLSVPPCVGAMLWLVLTNFPALRQAREDYAVAPRVARLLPPAPDALVELLALCRQTQPARYSVIDQTSYRLPAGAGNLSQNSWLPLGSNALYAPLPNERRQFYLDAHARGEPGWLLFPANTSGPEFAWIFEYVRSRYRLQTTLEQADWRAWLLIPPDGSPLSDPGGR